MGNITLNKKQTKHLGLLVGCFNNSSISKDFIPIEVKARISLIDHMVRDNVGFTQKEFDVILFILELYFSVFEESDIDPLAEQCYAKINGEWPFIEPYYNRMLIYQDKKFGRDYKLEV